MRKYCEISLQLFYDALKSGAFRGSKHVLKRQKSVRLEQNDTPNENRLSYNSNGDSILVNRTLPYSAFERSTATVAFKPTDRRSPRTAQVCELPLRQVLDPPYSAV